jgi:hypothetical protein
MVNVLGFSFPYARAGHHLLTEELKAQRITVSIEMLRILQRQGPMNFAGVVTWGKS